MFFETNKANYHMLWLAFFVFYQDKINLFSSEFCE